MLIFCYLIKPWITFTISLKPKPSFDHKHPTIFAHVSIISSLSKVVELVIQFKVHDFLHKEKFGFWQITPFLETEPNNVFMYCKPILIKVQKILNWELWRACIVIRFFDAVIIYSKTSQHRRTRLGEKTGYNTSFCVRLT